VAREYKPKCGLEMVFMGDGQHYHVDAFPDDVEIIFDSASLVYTVYLREYEAKELFWELLEIIPKLRKDRH
jgi:hypothetical protein